MNYHLRERNNSYKKVKCKLKLILCLIHNEFLFNCKSFLGQ